MARRRVILLAGGLASGVAVMAAALWVSDGGDDPDGADGAGGGFRPSTVVAGAVLRPASGRALAPADGTAGELGWQVLDGAVVVQRGGRTVLRTDDGARFAAAAVRPADLDGDGRDELVASFRGAGSGGLLEVDVVSADGDVVFHGEADKGVAAVEGDRLTIYAARFGPDDPNCCPSTYQRRVVELRGGRWSAVATGEVPADQLPDDRLPAGQVPAGQP